MQVVTAGKEDPWDFDESGRSVVLRLLSLKCGGVRPGSRGVLEPLVISGREEIWCRPERFPRFETGACLSPFSTVERC